MWRKSNSIMRGWNYRLLLVLSTLLIGAGLTGCRGKKYENPITKDTLQPDKILFDKAMKDVEKNRFEVARLTLNTLMNTYDTSEYMAKAKLLYADSWFREGTSSAMAQAEAEYKDFILFFPQMEESAEAQNRICDIHYRQMGKATRDPLHAIRAEQECRQLLVMFPNSKFAPVAEQKMRNIQEVLAQSEFGVGTFYLTKGSWASAANRLQTASDQFPLFSNADELLFKLGGSYEKLGPRFKGRAGEAYARIVKDYPLSKYVEEAKKKLKSMELPIPEPDQVAYNRMKFEQENRTKTGMIRKSLLFIGSKPDMAAAAKSGKPAMTSLRPGTPMSIPGAPEPGRFGGDIDVTTVGGDSQLDKKPDARTAKPAATPESETPATQKP